MPLEKARRTLEQAGVAVAVLKPAAPPEGTGRPPAGNVELSLFVASQTENESRAVTLRVVSVPSVDTDAAPGAPAAAHRE